MVAIERELPLPAATPSADAIPLALRRRGGTPRQVLGLTLVGTLVLAVFAAPDLSSWLDRMGDGPLIVELQRAATTWNDTMTRIGLTAPHEALRSTVRHLLDAGW